MPFSPHEPSNAPERFVQLIPTDCADAAFQLVAACGALAALAAVNSEHTGHVAKAVAMVCRDCQKACEKYPKVAECKACGESC